MVVLDAAAFFGGLVVLAVVAARLAGGISELLIVFSIAASVSDTATVRGIFGDLRPTGGQQLEQRLLRVPAVLRLVPDALAWAVQHFGRDLVARMRRQAVQRDRSWRRQVKQRIIDPIAGERRTARLVVAGSSLMLTHTSVYTALAPATASRGSSVKNTPGSGSS